jgi:peptide/nickel transport system substrate-binding protein
MRRNRGGFAAAFALSLALAAPIADAQKSGGVLIMSHFDSPASMSMHEEATGAVNRPMMGVFNNLVMYRQDVAQTAWRRSFRTWPPAGRGTRRGPS